TILWETDEAALRAAYDTLLARRGGLRRQPGRPGDQLLPQEQDGGAAALGYEDADALRRADAAAARPLAGTGDAAWSRRETARAGGCAVRTTWAAACAGATARWRSPTRRRWPAIPRWRCAPPRRPRRAAPGSSVGRWTAWPPRHPRPPSRGTRPPGARWWSCW